MSNLQSMGAWHIALPLAMAIVLASSAFWLYRRQVHTADLGVVGWILPTLRALTVSMITLTLAEPVLESRTSEGELARVTFLLDTSRSMSFADEAMQTQPALNHQYSQANRFERAVKLLSGKSGILSELSNDFLLRVVRFDRQAGGEIWNSRTGQALDNAELTFDWAPAVWGEATAVGDAMEFLTVTPRTEAVSEERRTEQPPVASGSPVDSLVVLTDGQSNHGESPLAVAEQLGQRGVTVFAVGFGPFQHGPDLALRQFSLPERLYRTDTLTGTVTIEQRLAQEQRFTLQIEHNAQIVWQETSVATAEPQREIPFAFSVSPLFANALSQLPSGTEVAKLPLKLTARLVVKGDESNQLNNARESTTMVASHKSRLLLIDGRSRWESRYLKNMFSRDPSWQVEPFILPQFAVTTQLPTSSVNTAALNQNSNQLPDTKEKLFDYDLVIIGEVEPFSLSDEFLQWLREYVELAGGGLIIIDGARQTLRDLQFAPLHQLSPVAWPDHRPSRSKSVRSVLSKRPRPTLTGNALAALSLSSEGPSANAQIWASLPPLEFVSDVTPLPGAEILIEAVNEVDRVPLLVTRRYGAGRVLYSASDETWRWRFELAERVHSRLWLQLARWTMKTPLSLRTEFLSLDTGAASYTPGQPIDVRCQLRGTDGLPATKLAASAIVTSGDRIVTTVPLAEDSVLGTYTAVLESLPAGDYQVQIAAPGFSTQALSLQSHFSVVAPPSQEMEQLTCDEGTLAALANKTGGKYLRESQGAELADLLQPQVQGKIQTATWLLWQSYWWFTTAMLLLIAEWILRKRVGLV